MFKGDKVDQSLPLPLEIVRHHPILEPQAILQYKDIDVQGQSVTQLLVWWQGLLPTDATWEDKVEFQRAYPDFNLEDKVVVDGGGIDTSEADKETTEEPRGNESASWQEEELWQVQVGLEELLTSL